MTPLNVSDIEFIPLTPTPCVKSHAVAGLISLPSLAALARCATYSASLFENYQWANSAVLDIAGRGLVTHLAIRELMLRMQLASIPLILAMGLKTDVNVAKYYQNAYELCKNGSVFLVCDNNRNVVGIVRPMGLPVLARTDERGLLPPALRETNQSFSAFQMVVEIVGVAPYPALAFESWFGKTCPLTHHFNYACDAAFSNKALTGWSANFYLTTRTFMSSLFKHFWLSHLESCLGNYQDALAALTGPDDNAVDNRVMWRRATLFRLAVQYDMSGLARGTLTSILPESMLGPSVAAIAVAEPKHGVTLATREVPSTDAVRGLATLLCPAF